MKIQVLLLSSNPKNLRVLRVEEEFREIQESIKISENRESFEVVHASAVRIKDMRRLVLEEQPHILHFSGHGSEDGIFLEDDNGFSQLVTGESLSEFFSLCESVVCLILNSCLSYNQAVLIKKSTPYTIGMNRPIEDPKAILFSIGFYDALAAKRSIKKAFLFGKNAMNLNRDNIPTNARSLGTEKDRPHYESKIPVLLKGSPLRELPAKKAYHFSRREFLISAASISSISALGWFGYDYLMSSPSSSTLGLVKNKNTGTVHLDTLGMKHLPKEKNREKKNFEVNFSSFNGRVSQKILTSIYPNLSDFDKERLLKSAIDENPKSTHLYTYLIKLYGKHKKYSEIHTLLEKNIKLLEVKKNLHRSSDGALNKHGWKYKKAIEELKLRSAKADFKAQLSKKVTS